MFQVLNHWSLSQIMCEKGTMRYKWLSMHHPLIHDVPWVGPRPGKAAKASRKPKESSKPEAEKTEVESITCTTIITTGDTTPLLPIVAVILKSSKPFIRTLALLDTGSEATQIRQDIAEKLALEGPSRISTFHADDPPSTTRRVNFDIQSVDGSSNFQIRRAHTVQAMHLKKRSVQWSGVLCRWPHLREIEFPTHKPSDVTVIVGCDHPDLLDVFETRRVPLRSGSPRAVITPFGWCVIGPVAGKESTDKLN